MAAHPLLQFFGRRVIATVERPLTVELESVENIQVAICHPELYLIRVYSQPDRIVAYDFMAGSERL